MATKKQLYRSCTTHATPFVDDLETYRGQNSYSVAADSDSGEGFYRRSRFSFHSMQQLILL